MESLPPWRRPVNSGVAWWSREQAASVVGGDRPKSVDEFVAAANAVSNSPGDTLGFARGGIYPCRPQQLLYQHMWDRATRLTNREFVNKSGIASQLVLGVRGIGKTNALRGFASLAPWAFPGLVCIYVSFADPGVSVFSRRTLLSVLCEESRAFLGVEGPAVEDEEQYNALTNVLAANNARLVLLIDEFERLFTAPATDDLPRRTLECVAALANDPSGAALAIVCGSTVSLRDFLDARHAPPHLLERYPVLRSGVDLNTSKFGLVPLYCPPPHETATARAVLVARGLEPVDELARWVTFFTGSNARDAEEFVGRCLGAPRSETQPPAFDIAAHDHRAFLASLYAALREKNKHVLGLLAPGKTTAEQAIRGFPWDAEDNLQPPAENRKDRIQPLLSAEVRQVWGSLSSSELPYVLRDFIDRGFVCTEDVVAGFPTKLYPKSLWALVTLDLDESVALEHFRNLLRGMLGSRPKSNPTTPPPGDTVSAGLLTGAASAVGSDAVGGVGRVVNYLGRR